MTLRVTRITRTEFGPSEDTTGTAISAPSYGGVVEIGWYDFPYSTPNEEHSLILYRDTIFKGVGGVRQRELEEYQYDQVVVDDRIAPTGRRKQIWALTWLPGVSHGRSALFRVADEQTEIVAPAEHWRGRPEEWVTRRWAWVVYDLARDEYPITPEYRQWLESAGYTTAETTTRRLLHTARVWNVAIADAAIIEESDAAQQAVWQLYQTERRWVTEDSLRWYVWTVIHDHLTGQTEMRGPETYMKGAPGTVLPLEMEAPNVKAFCAGAQGIIIEIRGGWAKYQKYGGGEMRLPPDGYLVYRRPTRRTRTTYSQSLNLGGAPEEKKTALELTEKTNTFGGTPAPLPIGQHLLDMLEDNVALNPADYWQAIADVKNGALPGRVPRAAVQDIEVQAEVTYEYYAVAYRGDLTSPPSNYVETTCVHGPNVQGLITTVRSEVKRTPTDRRLITVDTVLPPDPTYSNLDLDGSDAVYGDTVEYTVPAKVESLWPETRAIERPGDGTELIDWSPAANNEPWEPRHPEFLKTADDIAAAVATGQWLRWRRRLRARVTLAAPLWHIERGMRVKMDPTEFQTYVGQWRLTSTTASGNWVVEGFTLTRDRTGFKMDVELEEA